MRGVAPVSLLLWLFALASAAAQQTTGDIQGRVAGPNGQPLSDVQVSATSPSLQGVRQTTSDARGRFALPSLSAGSYAVALRRIGYGPLRLQDVPVRLGSTTSLGDVSLQEQAVDVAEVVVSGAKPVIDPVSPASGATLDSSQFSALPFGRDFRDLIPFVPQANASPYANTFWQIADEVNIGGSTGLENAFYIDGMNVTVLTGTSISLPSNFVREIQVNTGGYEAEYGRALSGVINVVTPSGSNAFHGQALGYFTADELRTAPRVGVGEINPVNITKYDVGLSLSGPIQRDRLWYSVAYDPTSANQDVTLAAIPKQTDTYVRHQLAAKLTWSPGTKTDVALTFLGDPYAHDWLVGFVLPATTDPNTVLIHETGGGTTLAVEGRERFGPRTQLAVGVSHLGRHEDILPQSGANSLGAWTRLDDNITNVSSGGTFGPDTSRESRTAVRLALTLLTGRHSWKFGAEFEDNRFAEGGIYSEIARLADTVNHDTVYVWSENYGHEHVRNRVPTVYVQDAWEVTPRFRVSAGVRWESQHMTGDVGPARTIASELAPRLGLVYEVGAPGSQRLFASAGRFYEQIPLWAVIFWNSTGAQLFRQYPQNPLVDSSNGVYLSRPFIYGQIPATHDLQGQSYDQLTVGYDRALGRSIKVSAHATYRMLHWAIEDGVPPGDSNSVLRMGNPGRGPLAAMPRAQQRYAALELSVERTTVGPLYLMASYVLSRNIGNYTGLYATDYQLSHPNSGPQYDYPDLMTNSYGLLPNDRTHVAKAAASYRFRFGATLGGFLTAASGTPLNEYGTSAYAYGYYTFLRPRGSVGRTPAIWSLDLHGSYDLPVPQGARVRPKLLLDVFNVGSPRQALLYDQVHYLDAGKTVPNQPYGAVTRYQPPMSARVSMVVDF
jgi:hypothetical protein